MKKVFYTELAYIIGIIGIAIGTALSEASDFGVSMIVAPAYLLYRIVSQNVSFFTFGMAEYIFQGFLLIIMILVIRKFKPSYLFSFVTAIIYGLILDGAMWLVAFVPNQTIAARTILYIGGLLMCAFGVSLMFHTYISPEVYELFVKEVSSVYKLPINKFKTVYDCISCILGIAISFAAFGFGRFEGVKFGTVICALLNGFLIGRFSAAMEKHFNFKDALKLRHLF